MPYKWIEIKTIYTYYVLYIWYNALLSSNNVEIYLHWGTYDCQEKYCKQQRANAKKIVPINFTDNASVYADCELLK